MYRIFLLTTAALAIIFVFIGCDDPPKSFTKLDDLHNASIGAMTGTTGEELVKKRYPDADIKSFDDIMDAIAALKSNQVDAVITSFTTANNVCKHNSDLVTLPEPVDYENTCIAVRKGNDELLASLNSFIDELYKDGTLEDMQRRWFKKDLLPYETKKFRLPEIGKPLKIGVSATREPFCYVDAEKNVTGHDGELARRIGIKLGRPVEFYDMKFSALISALQAGKIDMIVTGMTATPERSKSVDFTTSYFKNSQVILVKAANSEMAEEKKNLPLNLAGKLKNKRVAVLVGSTHDTYATQNFTGSEVMQYKVPADIMLAVKTGKADAAIYITQTLMEMVRKDNSLTIVGDTLFSSEVGMGFNKNSDELREKFNEFLMKIKKDGTYDDIIKRWVNEGSTDMPQINNSKDNGILNVGIMGDKGLPFAVVKNNQFVGLDIEFAERFAAYLGKELKLSPMDFGSLIAAAAAGKIDMISCTVVITEER
ncbi:MAG: transporter substrate-binding domain-containing protein, partial [Ignavibacteriaceae bacterium]